MMVEKQHAQPMQASSATFWWTVLKVRLRFFGFVAALALLFAVWPWMSATWDRWAARWQGPAQDAAVGGGSEFFCPMDPGVVSAWPAICPICNMDLIRRQKTDALLLPEGVLARMQLSPYKLSLAGIKTVEIQPVSSEVGSTSDKEPTRSVLVPNTAIVYRDRQPFVYVESMPGMFDAIAVEIQKTPGDAQIVAGALQPGQRVVAMGALLLDAESRLKPNLSTQYFGAAQSAPTVEQPVLPTRETKESKQPLPPEDQRLVDQQQLCPVTKAPLGSMGKPIFVEVKNRRIALCCAGCKGRMLAEPDKYLSWLDGRNSAAEPASKQ